MYFIDLIVSNIRPPTPTTNNKYGRALNTKTMDIGGSLLPTLPLLIGLVLLVSGAPTDCTIITFYESVGLARIPLAESTILSLIANRLISPLILDIRRRQLAFYAHCIIVLIDSIPARS